MPNHPKGNSSTNPRFELPQDRLASTTETGDRVYLYPAFFRGKFKTWRTWIYGLLILVFLGLPWVQVDHHSAILIDIAHRKFAIFGLTFWGHDVPILFLVLFLFVLILGCTTALFGRVWCGWACPQTVFIEGLFRRIEVFIEGTPKDRVALDRSPLTAQKLLKRSLKWSLFILISFGITHSFLAYFTGTELLKAMITTPPAQHPHAFLAMLVANAIILFNFGWFREQFCIIACPYGRLQSVFMDSDSLIVGYDSRRTDCVSCDRCVRVCPTGVDIRRGVQMECIMCTACIDACNTVMTRVGQPINLISYTTGTRLGGGRTRWLRPRVGIYVGLILVVIIALGFIVTTRDLTPIFARISKVAPYQSLPNGEIVNPFTFSIHNQYFDSITITLRPDPSDPNATHITWITPTPTLTIPGGGNATQIVMIQYPAALLRSGKRVLKFQKIISHPHHGFIQKTEEITLVGPLL